MFIDFTFEIFWIFWLVIVITIIEVINFIIKFFDRLGEIRNENSNMEKFPKENKKIRQQKQKIQPDRKTEYYVKDTKKSKTKKPQTIEEIQEQNKEGLGDNN